MSTGQKDHKTISLGTCINYQLPKGSEVNTNLVGQKDTVCVCVCVCVPGTRVSARALVGSMQSESVHSVKAMVW